MKHLDTWKNKRKVQSNIAQSKHMSAWDQPGAQGILEMAEEAGVPRLATAGTSGGSAALHIWVSFW